MSFYKYSQVYSLADTGFAGTYTAITGAVIPSEAVAIRIVTTLDASCMLSLDGGVTDHLPVNKASEFVPEVIPLVTDDDGGYCYHAGSTIYVKDIGTSTTGSIYVSFIYRV